jgi:hypothetical protein
VGVAVTGERILDIVLTVIDIPFFFFVQSMWKKIKLCRVCDEMLTGLSWLCVRLIISLKNRVLHTSAQRRGSRLSTISRSNNIAHLGIPRGHRTANFTTVFLASAR